GCGAAPRRHDAAQLEEMTRRRVAGEFLEHVVGEVDVLGERLAVASGVFVPRRRTALLITKTLRAARERPARRVLELCAGAAPVAALVARRLPSARVHAADVDPGRSREGRTDWRWCVRCWPVPPITSPPAACSCWRCTVSSAMPPRRRRGRADGSAPWTGCWRTMTPPRCCESVPRLRGTWKDAGPHPCLSRRDAARPCERATGIEPA